MATTEYTYSVSQDFPNQRVNPDTLTDQIQDSSIVTALDYINVVDDDCDIYFKDALSTTDESTLDTIVANHQGDPTPAQAEDVNVANFATLEHPTGDSYEVQRTVTQPGRTGYYMCDKDVRVSTSMYAEGDAIEDLKVQVSNNVRSSWGEVSLVGCYKSDGQGGYTTCTNQTDADTNACLTIIDFLAIDQTTEDEIEYDFKGGCLWSDVDLEAPVWDHQLYAMMAPNISPSQGGGVCFFDGYLYPYEGKWQQAINSLALEVDPSQTIEAARIRFWFYYPAGAKHNHVLRMITYRQPSTF